VQRCSIGQPRGLVYRNPTQYRPARRHVQLTVSPQTVPGLRKVVSPCALASVVWVGLSTPCGAAHTSAATAQVLPSLRDLRDETLLRELHKRWQNHNVMIRWLSRFFNYLDRFAQAPLSSPTPHGCKVTDVAWSLLNARYYCTATVQAIVPRGLLTAICCAA